MFTSDNGGAGYIGLPDVNQPFRGWKITMFEGHQGTNDDALATNIAPGTRIDQPVAHIDVMPTIAAAADAPLPEGRVIDGVDILPLVNSEVRENWSRKTYFGKMGTIKLFVMKTGM